jgi:hypothetical protein
MTYVRQYIPPQHVYHPTPPRDFGDYAQLPGHRTFGQVVDSIKDAAEDHKEARDTKVATHRQDSEVKQQVRQELREAGLNWLDMLTIESHYIHNLIHPNEHIQAAVSGRSNLGALPALIIATNLRVVYLHRIPLFMTMDEISYDLVTGISYNKIGPWYASVTLHTRNGDYELTFVNLRAANKFVETMEQSSIDRRSVRMSGFKKPDKVMIP